MFRTLPGGGQEQLGTGTYARLAYNGNFLVGFRVTLGGANYDTGLLDERFGYFLIKFPTLSPYAIKFTYDGP